MAPRKTANVFKIIIYWLWNWLFLVPKTWTMIYTHLYTLVTVSLGFLKGGHYVPPPWAYGAPKSLVQIGLKNASKLDIFFYKKVEIRLLLIKSFLRNQRFVNKILLMTTRFFIRNDKTASSTRSFLIFTPFLVPKIS